MRVDWWRKYFDKNLNNMFCRGNANCTMGLPDRALFQEGQSPVCFKRFWRETFLLSADRRFRAAEVLDQEVKKLTAEQQELGRQMDRALSEMMRAARKRFVASASV